MYLSIFQSLKDNCYCLNLFLHSSLAWHIWHHHTRIDIVEEKLMEKMIQFWCNRFIIMRKSFIAYITTSWWYIVLHDSISLFISFGYFIFFTFSPLNDTSVIIVRRVLPLVARAWSNNDLLVYGMRMRGRRSRIESVCWPLDAIKYCVIYYEFRSFNVGVTFIFMILIIYYFNFVCVWHIFKYGLTLLRRVTYQWVVKYCITLSM